jgi:hypothetical protein
MRPRNFRQVLLVEKTDFESLWLCFEHRNRDLNHSEEWYKSDENPWWNGKWIERDVSIYIKNFIHKKELRRKWYSTSFWNFFVLFEFWIFRFYFNLNFSFFIQILGFSFLFEFIWNIRLLWVSKPQTAKIHTKP